MPPLEVKYVNWSLKNPETFNTDPQPAQHGTVGKWAPNPFSEVNNKPYNGILSWLMSGNTTQVTAGTTLDQDGRNTFENIFTFKGKVELVVNGIAYLAISRSNSTSYHEECIIINETI